ncbi:acetyltransferase [Bacteroidia bacterium]|nr:acetyltransferase [Bacteroidia bacterium]GHT48118.1 acetyltransferase [Bacteroidia bacterium]
MKKWIRSIFKYFFLRLFPEASFLTEKDVNTGEIRSHCSESKIGKNVNLFPAYKILYSTIGDYTYVAKNSNISYTKIGKFCSIGPNFLCGWGIHPVNGLSTSPMFYSTHRQNGVTLSKVDKVEERKEIGIGNDVFIGANVIILDGVSIGDGAIIGAGAVVSKNIPPYAIAVGCPIKIIKYRMSDNQIKAMQKIKWWNFSEDQLPSVEKYFFDIDRFINIFLTDEIINYNN